MLIICKQNIFKNKTEKRGQNMTIKELSQLYYLKKEIAMDKKRLAELRLTAASPSGANITGMPRGSEEECSLERKCERILNLECLINAKIEKCESERIRIENYIATIDDSFLRQVFTYRFINNYTWRQVANRVGGYNTADGVRKACKRYLMQK